MGSPFSFDIIYTTSPQQDDIIHHDTYNSEGDPMTNLKTFKFYVVIMLMIIGF